MAEDATTPAAEAAPASGGRPASDFRDIADALRNRVDLFGKTLAAFATIATSAVGLTKIGDLFPAKGNTGWVIAACLGLGIAALAAIGIAVLLMRVSRPIFMQADLDSMKDLEEGEAEAVRPVYQDAATRFGYSSLVGLQERERSLRHAASRAIDEDERARRTALADEVKTEIEQALARAQVVVVRRRATGAVSGPLAWLAYVAVVAGLIVFAVGTDKVSSDRKDPIADAKACGDARKAGATAGELGRTNAVCDEAAAPAEQALGPPSADVARAQIASQLNDTLKACAGLVKEEGDANSGPLASDDCDPLREALTKIDAP